MKKIFMLTFAILVTICLSTSVFCYAVTVDDGVVRFNQIVAQMGETYQAFMNEECEILTPQYYALINEGDELLSIAEIDEACDESVKRQFYEYKHFYYLQKTLKETRDTFISGTFTIEFEDKTFYFYADQWNGVELVYNEYLEKIQSASSQSDLESTFAEYRLAIESLTDREELDAIIEGFVEQAIKLIDLAVVDEVNNALALKGLIQIDEDSIETYHRASENTLYDEWFTEMLTKGYTTANAIKVASLHSTAIQKILQLDIFANQNEYEKIANETIIEILKIETSVGSDNEYLLESCKQAALMSLNSSYPSDDEDINDSAKAKLRAILSEGIQKINEATTISEVQSLLIEYQNKLAEVDAADDSWITPLVAGVALIIIAIIIIILIVVFKRRQNARQLAKKKLHRQREFVNREIDLAISSLEGRDNNGNLE